jgi:hypothetical protein
VADSHTFGRRGLSSAPPPRAPAGPRPIASEPPNPRLEAFRASLKGRPAAEELSEDQAFEQWLRARRPRLWLLIGVRLAFLAPGLLCFAFHAPWWVSLTIEGAGLFANGWIKTERARQAQAIARWSAQADA